MTVLVHRAVEPDKLTRKGKARLEAMLRDGEYILQPKLDGVYCQIVGGVAYSRTGEVLKSLSPRILSHFEDLEPSWRFIGELWRPFTEHSAINGMARKQTPQEGLELVLFDAVDDNSPEPYEDRYYPLHDQDWPRGIEVVQNITVQYTELDDFYDLAKDIRAKPSAYDGLVLKDSKGLFVPGSGKDGGAIKIKPRLSGDFRVVGTTEGKGNRAGGMGALVVDLGGGVSCEVGTGLTMADVFDRGPTFFMGKIVEVEYLAITSDGRLREPVLKSVRFDKIEADVLACNVGGSD